MFSVHIRAMWGHSSHVTIIKVVNFSVLEDIQTATIIQQNIRQELAPLSQKFATTLQMFRKIGLGETSVDGTEEAQEPRGNWLIFKSCAGGKERKIPRESVLKTP